MQGQVSMLGKEIGMLNFGQAPRSVAKQNLCKAGISEGAGYGVSAQFHYKKMYPKDFLKLTSFPSAFGLRDDKLLDKKADHWVGPSACGGWHL